MRDRFPNAHLEILGYRQIAALAEKRFYADEVRSIEMAALAKLFAKSAESSADLARYFASFDFILSYLHDPEGIFEANVRRMGAANFLAGPSKVDNSEHAARQLARPLATIGLSLTDPAARIFPNAADREAVRHFREIDGQQIVVLHPGSGSETKNWPTENWIRFGNLLLSKGHDLLILAGEADGERVAGLKAAWSQRAVQFAENLPLPHVAALLERRFFVGHDSGISHIAGAVGARCLLLFGWTDPKIWAPASPNVTVLRAPEGKMRLLEVETVAYELMRIGIRT